MRAYPWSALPTPTGEPWSYLTTCWAHLWYGGYDQANSPRESRTTSSKLGMTPRPENPATSRNHCTSLKRSGILPAIPSGAGSCDDIGCEEMQKNGSLAELREAVHVVQQQGDAAHHLPRILRQQHAFHGQGLEVVGRPLQLRALLAGLEALLHMVGEGLSLRRHGSIQKLSFHTTGFYENSPGLLSWVRQPSFVRSRLVCYPGTASQD